MRKYWKVGLAAVFVAALAVTGMGVAYAQGNAPVEPAALGPWGPQGGRGPGVGPLAEYRDVIHQALADTLGISVDTFEQAIDDGQTLVDLADEYDVDLADLRTAMEEARAEVLDQAVDDGVITQVQADWMEQHNLRMRARRNAACDGDGPMGEGPMGDGPMGRGGRRGR
ncbi:MAG: hypothetical protein WBR18_03485 [Anaerolineales bacterium]